MEASPDSIDAFIQYVLNHKNSTKHKSPCTFCGTCQSTTWRPGPTGASSLCNKCGVYYMDTGGRKRSIDLVLQKGKPVWVKKDPVSWEWTPQHDADATDVRIIDWMTRETIRNKIIHTMNPAPSKKRRL